MEFRQWLAFPRGPTARDWLSVFSVAANSFDRQYDNLSRPVDKAPQVSLGVRSSEGHSTEGCLGKLERARRSRAGHLGLQLCECSRRETRVPKQGFDIRKEEAL